MLNFLRKIAPSFLFRWYHFTLAFLGACLYRFPSYPPKLMLGRVKHLKVIGITGTNGKTTTTEMVARVLQEAGYRVALANSLRFKINDVQKPNMFKMTMPGRFFIQKFLRAALRAGCQYAVLEVTSEGIKQHRHRFIDFEVVVFTNLAPEHIESHGSFERYRAAKGELFRACKKIHIINKDDANAGYFLKFPSAKKFTFGKKEATALLRSSKLLGEFNAWNAAAAAKVGLSQGIDWKVCQKAIEKVELVPGRMEQVISEPFRTIIDYAVTPDTLEQTYKTIKKIFSPQKLICVLGACGGGRDKWKRPVLGEIAAKCCGVIILTNEDPYDENPRQILSMIKSGIFNIKFSPPDLYEILDRREAIRKALELARSGDAVIITGKGSEPWMCFERGKKIPWDERRVILQEYEKIQNTGT